jgi:hypothetical protein
MSSTFIDTGGGMKPANYPQILFVGDKPSPKNVHPYLAFWGTKSYDTLMDWCRRMYVHHSQINMINQCHIISIRQVVDFITVHYKTGLDSTNTEYISNCKVVALGKEAVKTLDKWGIDYFELPHPSGLCRKNNDKAMLEQKLTECNNYIFSEIDKI